MSTGCSQCRARSLTFPYKKPNSLHFRPNPADITVKVALRAQEESPPEVALGLPVFRGFPRFSGSAEAGSAPVGWIAYVLEIAAAGLAGIACRLLLSGAAAGGLHGV